MGMIHRACCGLQDSQKGEKDLKRATKAMSSGGGESW